MAKVGHFSNYRIEIYSKEGPIPHFHFINEQNEKVNGCIRLDKNEYFSHGYHKAILNSKNKDYLVEFLEQNTDGGFTNYEKLCMAWNKLNPSPKCQLNINKMPDYHKEIKEIK